MHDVVKRRELEWTGRETTALARIQADVEPMYGENLWRTYREKRPRNQRAVS